MRALKQLFPILLAMFTAAGAAPALASNTEVPAGTRVAIARTSMTILPPVALNRLGTRPGRFAETWTLDGTQLNRFLLIAGVPSGTAILRERDKRDKPLPRFDAAMDANSLFDLFAGTLMSASPGLTMTATSIRPIDRQGCVGVVADWRETRPDDDLQRSGRAMLCTRDGKFYAISLTAPSIFYFDRDARIVDQLLESVAF